MISSHQGAPYAHAIMTTTTSTRSADWHLSFFLEDDQKIYDDIFQRAWGTKVGDSFVTAVGYYVENLRIQTGHALIQLSREVDSTDIESYVRYVARLKGRFCLFPVRGSVMPSFLVTKLERAHGTFATFSVKDLYA